MDPDSLLLIGVHCSQLSKYSSILMLLSIITCIHVAWKHFRRSKCSKVQLSIGIAVQLVKDLSRIRHNVFEMLRAVDITDTHLCSMLWAADQWKFTQLNWLSNEQCILCQVKDSCIYCKVFLWLWCKELYKVVPGVSHCPSLLEVV